MSAREPEPGPFSPGRLRRWLRLPADPPLPRPAAPRLPPVRRAWPTAVLHARAAVVARVSLADFLRARLARYEARLAVPRARLPVRVELAGGELRATSIEEPLAAAALGGDPLAALLALEGPAAERRWSEVQARVAALEAEEAAARRRAEEISGRFSADLTRGAIAPAPDPALSARALGRPPIRSVAGVAVLGAVAAAATLAEAWAIALPMLLAIGSYPPPLALGPDALAPGLVAGFALGVAVGLLALALAAVDALALRARGLPRRTRRRLVAWGAAAAFLTAAAVAAAAGAPVLQAGIPPTREALLLLALPGGAALALRAARRQRRRRAAETEAALAWDRARAQALSERARRLEELAWAEAQLHAVRERCERARRRAGELRRRAEAAARIVARADRRERMARYRLAVSLVGALERDRYEYVRQAAARGLDELAPGARGKPPEPRPAPKDLSASGRVAV